MTREARKPTKGVKKKKIVEEEQILWRRSKASRRKMQNGLSLLLRRDNIQQGLQ